MNPITRRAAAAVLAVLSLAAMAALSYVPYTADTTGQSVVRLAWRAHVEPIEDCRHLTPEELERLPVHMRRAEDCEGRVPPYRLTVLLDGVMNVDERVRAAGARQDRPIYVFRELVAAPGVHRVVVRFTREAPPPAVARHEREERPEHEAPEGQRWFPVDIGLDTSLTLEPRDAVVVTYDETRAVLVVKRR